MRDNKKDIVDDILDKSAKIDILDIPKHIINKTFDAKTYNMLSDLDFFNTDDD